MAEILGYSAKTIAPAGRNKYGNYIAAGNVTKSVINTTYGGNNTTTTIGDTGGQDNGGDNLAFFCMFSNSNITFKAVDLASGATVTTDVIAYRSWTKAPTLVMDLSSITAITEDNIVQSLETPENYGIVGIPSGMTVTAYNNGTTATTLSITATSTLTGTTGTLSIPVAIYRRDTAVPDGDGDGEANGIYDWWDSRDDCEQVWLDLVWTVDRSATTNYLLDLSNQTAGVNCDSAGTLYENSIATLQCTATTYYNGAVATGITYTASAQPAYAAIGFSINANTGVMSFNSTGTNKFYWAPAYPALPIDIVAYKDGLPIATKTMTISRNYPGSDGTPAHTRYILTDYDYIVYDPNTSAFTPTQVVAQVWIQIGNELPTRDTGTTIYQWYDNLEQYKTSAQGSITAQTYDGISSISFALMNGDGDYYEIEEVPVVPKGKDGEPGNPGDPGASGESAWYLTLSNDNASINCDSEGNILPGAIRPQTCVCKLYHGSSQVTGSGVDYSRSANTSYTGVSFQNVSGTLSIVFNSSFDFDGDVLSITISASTESTVRDVKVMNITKAYAGENGDPAVTYWLEINYGEILYDPNTHSVSPNSITAAKYKQVGQEAAVPASDATIKYRWQSRSTGTWGSETTYSSAVSVTSGNCVSYSRLRFTLYVGSSQVDQEDVDILVNGLNGEPGEGRPGPAIRGPYDWEEHSGDTRCWCSGSASTSCDECDKWIDVIYKDDVYYYCNTTYYGKLSPWNNVKNYWTSGDTFDFIATNLLLANNAKIKFLTNNALYLMDANGNITGGAKGGTGTTFWAGAENPDDPADPAPFRVDVEGNIYAKKGVFAGYIQYPYTFVSDLDRAAARYKQDGYYTNCTAYTADERAYLVSDGYNQSTGIGIPADFVLPVPDSGWNGFTYEIIVEPKISRMDGASQLHVFVSGVTSNSVPTSCTMYCYAFTELRVSENFYLNGGKYTITCMPKHVGYDGVSYVWAITQATGAIDTYPAESNQTIETLSTLVATSYDSPNPLYKLTTYTGTKPNVYNPDQTMFIQK